MLDKFLATISILMLFAFMSVLVGFVKELDLTLVIVVGLLIAIHDFWTTFSRRSGADNNE